MALRRPAVRQAFRSLMRAGARALAARRGPRTAARAGQRPRAARWRSRSTRRHLARQAAVALRWAPSASISSRPWSTARRRGWRCPTFPRTRLVSRAACGCVRKKNARRAARRGRSARIRGMRFSAMDRPIPGSGARPRAATQVTVVRLAATACSTPATRLPAISTFRSRPVFTVARICDSFRIAACTKSRATSGFRFRSRGCDTRTVSAPAL